LVNTGHRFFGTVSRGLAQVVEKAVSQWGLPNGYILGEEAAGAFVAGLLLAETEYRRAIEAMIARVVHLGFEVRLELELPEGALARAQLTRAQSEELELARGDVVYVRPPSEVTLPA